MAKFDAGAAVEPMEFDFTAYGGSKGVIPEPGTGAVNQFTKRTKAMLKEVKNMQGLAAEAEKMEDLTDEEMAEQMGKIDEVEEGANRLQEATITNLALLCGAKESKDDEGNTVIVGGSPGVEELRLLPFRVLQAFSTWLMGEIRPKRTAPATGPSPR